MCGSGDVDPVDVSWDVDAGADADEGVTQKVSPAPSQSLEVRTGVCT